MGKTVGLTEELTDNYVPVLLMSLVIIIMVLLRAVINEVHDKSSLTFPGVLRANTAGYDEVLKPVVRTRVVEVNSLCYFNETLHFLTT